MEVSNLFASGKDGDRIVALALIQARPNAVFFGLVSWTIGESRSAFEQYHGLKAMENMLPSLNEEQKRRLAEVLGDQRSGRPGKYIERGTDRWLLSDRILDALSPQKPPA